MCSWIVWIERCAIDSQMRKVGCETRRLWSCLLQATFVDTIHVVSFIIHHSILYTCDFAVVQHKIMVQGKNVLDKIYILIKSVLPQFSLCFRCRRVTKVELPQYIGADLRQSLILLYGVCLVFPFWVLVLVCSFLTSFLEGAIVLVGLRSANLGHPGASILTNNSLN